MKIKYFAALTMLLLYCNLAQAQRNRKNWTIGVHGNLTAGKIINATTWNTFGLYQSISSPFRFSYGIGLAIKARLNKSYYMPFNVDFINRRYAVANINHFPISSSNGNPNSYTWIKPEFFDYKINELLGSTGIGYKFSDKLAIELLAFMQVDLNSQKKKITSFFDWRDDYNNKHLYDLGLAMGFRYDLAKWYVRLNYHCGLEPDKSFGKSSNLSVDPRKELNPFIKRPRHNLAMLSFGYKLN